MQERTRHQVRPGGSPSGDYFDAADGPSMATVIHGTHYEPLPVAGLSVAQVRARFRDRLDLHPEAIAYLGADPVDDATRVRAGQVLIFVRPSGEKGVLP